AGRASLPHCPAGSFRCGPLPAGGGARDVGPAVDRPRGTGTCIRPVSGATVAAELHLLRTTAALRKPGVCGEGINRFPRGWRPRPGGLPLHMHVFLRYRSDPCRLEADWNVRSPRDVPERVAAQVRIADAELRHGAPIRPPDIVVVSIAR